jgi:hypothetical protein
MAKGEFEVRLVLNPADYHWLDQMAAAGGWPDVPTLAASLLHHLIEDDRACERAVVERAA